MADIHRDKWVLGNKEYAEGWERIFKKEGKNGKEIIEEVDSESDKAPRRVQRKGKKGSHEHSRVRRKGSKKGVSRVHKNKKTG